MNSKSIVKDIMKERGHTLASLAEKLGHVDANGSPQPNRVSERLRGKQDMRVDTLVKFLREMDCELVVRSTLRDKKEWTVTVSEDNV